MPLAALLRRGLPRRLVLALACFAAALASLRAQALDPNFTPAANSDVFALRIQPDGAILVGGNFTQIAGQARSRIARLRVDGSLDPSFTATVNSSLRCITLQADGRILLGGDFSTVNGTSRVRLARLNSDGSLDPNFFPSFDGSVAAIAVQPDGKILVGGMFTAVTGTARPRLARLNADGSLDATFTPTLAGTLNVAQAQLNAIVVTPTGHILIGGNFNFVDGALRGGFARLLPSGALDTTFATGAGFSGSVFAIALQPEGRILVGGSFSQFNGQPRSGLARLLADGRLDPATAAAAPVGATVMEIQPQPDGSIYIGGTFTSVGTAGHPRLARLDRNLALDPTFAPEVSGAIGFSTPGIYTLATSATGQLLLGGTFATIDGQNRSGLARFDHGIPVPTAAPTSFTAVSGADVTLRVTVLSLSPLTYQWRRNGTAIPGATTATLPLLNFDATQTGTYTVVVANAVSTVVTEPATLTLGQPGPTSLAITHPPAATHAEAGTQTGLSVGATGLNLTYQWKKDGAPLPDATNAGYVIPSVSAATHMGAYRVVVSQGGSSLESPPVFLTVSNPAVPGRLINLATRGLVRPGGDLIAGFVVRGRGEKPLVLRGVGPALAKFGVPGVLADPRLEYAPQGRPLSLLNDDWAATSILAQSSVVAGAFHLDLGSKDAASFLRTSISDVAAFSIRITGPNTTASGLALAEIYDADYVSLLTPPVVLPPTLTNLSARGYVGTGANALVPGFVIGGGGAVQLLIRAVGPSLAAFGVPEVLADPQISIIAAGQTTPLASNNDWGGTVPLAAAFAASGAFALPANSRDAALLIRLPPGAYSVVVTGVNATEGNALVEIYEVP